MNAQDLPAASAPKPSRESDVPGPRQSVSVQREPHRSGVNDEASSDAAPGERDQSRPGTTAPRARRLIIFDVDGTLVDSQHHIHAAVVAGFTEAGVRVPTLAETRAIVGLSLSVAIAELTPGLDEAARLRITETYRSGYASRRQIDPAPLFPGAAACLARLRARADIALGVATGKSRRGLDQLILQHGMEEHFVTMQVADDHPSKPDPSMIRAALAESGAAPADAVMVGDTRFDMAMARAAGIRAIGVAWGYHPPEDLLAAGAECVVADFDGLEAALDTLGVGS